MRPIYKLFTLILFMPTATSLYLARILILNEFKLRKFCLFRRAGRFGRSRSSKVSNIGANRKRICDFLLVRDSNLGPILHRFGDLTAFMCSRPHPYSTLILAVFPFGRCTRSPMLGVNEYMDPKLFGRELIFEEFQPIWSRYLIVTDRRTDRRHAIS